MPDFCHLHCHTQYSLLDGASHIDKLMAKVASDGQKAVALTDHGNMFGAFEFVSEAKKHDLKAILGCEFYLVEDRHKKSFSVSSGERDKRYHQLLLAKNAKGYENLCKLCSLGFIEGLYSKFPRIDKELLLQHHEGLIATSCCIGAEVPQAILRGDLDGAEKLLRWWIDLFGDDYYIELQRHDGLEGLGGENPISQEEVNQHLLAFAKKYDLKVIATNDAHYVEEEDWRPHDIILCVNTNAKVHETNRFKFSSPDYYMKTKAEMAMLFQDVPQALDNTLEIVDKIDQLELARDLLLPAFPLPKGFDNQPDYLRHLVYEGAKIRYGEVTQQIVQRIDHELGIIRNMGYEGYFLIVQDFIKAARQLNVRVGPGRGSAAGSAVAYCLTITDIDPIRYNLLFERFLNPERVSMPDIDIDFDDDGRQKVIDWVVDKYGKNQVAQIITFGTMAARSSIRDVARVKDVPLDVSDRLAKLVPSRPGTKLNKILSDPIQKLKSGFNQEEMMGIQQLREILNNEGNQESETLRLAMQVEGTVRNTGIHAAGVIIAPDDITKYMPVSKPKDSEFYVTQFDGNYVERAGMLKMDFLGLTTLSIINDAVANIAERYPDVGEIDLDDIPLDDAKTYELFQNAETIGIFQFESSGMRRYLRELVPSNIEDLIAMNALYRPGPMDYIPSFVARKHGREETVYPHEWLREMLEPTYGIMVYQEQIMQAAQIMADFSLGSADILRRAMGKKKKKEMDRQRVLFIEGSTAKGVDEKQANEIFDVMAKFASYGFNRSHAAAYSILAYQTAYLKAHYPAEFMASVLSHDKGDSKRLNILIREARRLGIKVLGPDINESKYNFAVNNDGNIRFGLSAIKGMGHGPVSEIIEKRELDGNYVSIIDFTKKVNARTVNKKAMEALALGGAFDCFEEMHRAQLIAPTGNFNNYYEAALKYGASYQQQKASIQNSLFGLEESFSLPEPAVPDCRQWTLIERLTKEKEISGIFLSGHPLDNYPMEVQNFTNCNISTMQQLKGAEILVAGVVTKSEARYSERSGTQYGRFEIQDYSDSLEFNLYKEQFTDFKSRLEIGQVILLKARYTTGYNGEERLRINDVSLLESAAASFAKELVLGIDLNLITEELITDIKTTLEEHKGNKPVRFSVERVDTNHILKFSNKAKKVELSSALIKKLRSLGLAYKITK